MIAATNLPDPALAGSEVEVTRILPTSSPAYVGPLWVQSPTAQRIALDGDLADGGVRS